MWLDWVCTWHLMINVFCKCLLENRVIWLNLQALHLICWCVEQPRTYLFIFLIHWCLLPETLNTLLKPAQHWLVGHLPLVCWMVFLDSDIQQQLLKVPNVVPMLFQCCSNVVPMLWEHTTSVVILVYCWPFPLLYWRYWSIPLFFALQMICAELGEGLHNLFFFFKEFSPTLLILSLLYSFFSLH